MGYLLPSCKQSTRSMSDREVPAEFTAVLLFSVFKSGLRCDWSVIQLRLGFASMSCNAAILQLLRCFGFVSVEVFELSSFC